MKPSITASTILLVGILASMQACSENNGEKKASASPCSNVARPANAKAPEDATSCVDDLPKTCGSDASESCCTTTDIGGACFSRSFDNITFVDSRFDAHIKAFQLDKYEVSVSRFRRFVEQYDQIQLEAGRGKSAYINKKDEKDEKPLDEPYQGWNEDWPLPKDANELRTSLACDDDPDATWSDEPDSDERERLPINCVNWYLASAFCTWDGGRLPTDAEWNLAASGGEEYRLYPWSDPANNADISEEHATYGGAPLTPVGATVKGGGRWGNADLAGNVAEWTLDYYANPYVQDPCVNCAQTKHFHFSWRTVRGGNNYSDEQGVTAANRTGADPEFGDYALGFRCAREWVTE